MVVLERCDDLQITAAALRQTCEGCVLAGSTLWNDEL
jgi:hypothetical protein